MKKIFTFLSITLLVAISFSAFAQPDTVFIAGDATPGTLKDAIIGDTMPNGERVNPLRCYELERGKTYFLAGIFAANFDLCIIANDDEAVRPPVISPSTAQDIPHDFICRGNVYFKNLYITNTAPDQTRNFGGILCFGEDKEYIIDNCVLEGNQWNGFVLFNKTKKITFINNVVRNAVNGGSPWNGRGLSTRDWPVTEVFIENNTFFNLNSFVFRGEWNEIKKLTFNHNTIVNSIKWPIQWHYPTDANFNDNIFYNTHSMGESASESAGQDVDSLPFGIFNLFELDQHAFIDSLGYTEAGRKINLKRNNWFYSSEITDFWASIDSVNAEPWMNARTQGWFDDDANYPMLSEHFTTNMDPNFVNAGTLGNWNTVDSMVLFMRGLRDTNVVKPAYWGYEPNGAAYNIEWPLPEDLSYTNGNLLWVAPGACPLGDLNWFPEKKEHCLTVANNQPTIKDGLTVEQNMPNPFKGQTTIAYTLDNASKVSVTILDINGRVITTLLNEHQAQGRHTVEWNVTNQATGTYFYQIKTDKALISRKLELIK